MIFAYNFEPLQNDWPRPSPDGFCTKKKYRGPVCAGNPKGDATTYTCYIYIYIYTIIHIETRQQWTHGYKNEMQPIQSTSKTNKITTHLLDNLWSASNTWFLGHRDKRFLNTQHFLLGWNILNLPCSFPNIRGLTLRKSTVTDAANWRSNHVRFGSYFHSST